MNWQIATWRGCTPWRCHTLANDFKSNNLAATAAALITFKIALSYIGQQNLHFLIAITGQICYHEGTNSSQNLANVCQAHFFAVVPKKGRRKLTHQIAGFKNLCIIKEVYL